MAHTTVYLIRHGEVDNPHKTLYGRSVDVPLSNVGRKQIKEIAEKIKGIGSKPQKIYSSPLGRAIETAKIIKEVLGNSIKIIIDEDLTDVYIPALVGQSFREMHEIHKSGTDEYSGKYLKKGNESREGIAYRMYRVFRKAVDESLDKSIAIVGHGHPFRFLLFRIANPDENNIPPIGELLKYDYIKKGQTMKIVVDSNYKIINKESIFSSVTED